MKKNNKEIAHLLYSEINSAVSWLSNMCDGDFDKLEKIHPDLPFMLFRLSSVVDWGAQTFNLDMESVDFRDEKTTIDFDKFIGVKCNKCEKELDDIVYTENIYKEVNLDLASLCPSCLEKKLNRKLTPNDFVDCEINRNNPFVKSLTNILN